MTEKKRGYWSWKKDQEPEQPLLPQPEDNGFYHPAKRYELSSLAHQSDEHLKHAILEAGGDAYYDRARLANAAMTEIADCDIQEFCQALGVKPYPKDWPPEIQQAWATYSNAAATEITHKKESLQPMQWVQRTEKMTAIAKKHGKHARKATGW